MFLLLSERCKQAEKRIFFNTYFNYSVLWSRWKYIFPSCISSTTYLFFLPHSSLSYSFLNYQTMWTSCVGTITKSIFRLPVLRSLSPYPGIIILNSKYSRIRENCTVSFMSTYLWMSFSNASVFKFSFFSNLRFLNSLDVSLQPQI